jgi:hypothetical protein
MRLQPKALAEELNRAIAKRYILRDDLTTLANLQSIAEPTAGIRSPSQLSRSQFRAYSRVAHAMGLGGYLLTLQQQAGGPEKAALVSGDLLFALSEAAARYVRPKRPHSRQQEG